MLDEHLARQVQNRGLERVPHFFLELEESGPVRHQRLVDRGLGREDRQALVRANHRTFDEQTVDAARIFDRVGEAAAGLEIERQRPGAEMYVEVEEGGRAATLLTE